MSEQVMKLSLPGALSTFPVRSGLLQRKCACGGTPGPTGECAACRQKREAATLQRAASHAAVNSVAPPIVHEVLRSPGQPLDAGTRTFMEPRFGHDFSQVRVHHDTMAVESARRVNALAYTVGRHVVFGPGQFVPGSISGRQLLAHELTHTLQQGDVRPQQTLSIAPTDDQHERAAVAAQAVVQSGDHGINVGPAAPTLQRACYRQTADLGTVSGCSGLSGDITDVATSSESLYLFRVNCDDFITSPSDDEARLRAFAQAIPLGMTVRIHGFASEEGPAEFNENLSCLRALKAKAVLEQAGVPSTQIEGVSKHGATPGIRADRRSVVVQPITLPERSAEPEDCSQLLGTCDFYLCRERRHPCGEQGYYKGYGYKYCRRFSQLESRLPASGKIWVRKTRLCLQEYIDRNVPIDAPCPTVKQMAFDSHPTCYVHGGVCFLGPAQWSEILGVIDPPDNDLKQAVLTGVSCFGNWVPLGLFPQHGLGAGGGFRGLMERDRQRMRQLQQQGP